MTLREFLKLKLLSGNLAIILEKNKPCDAHCENCACDLHPTLNITRNCGVILTEEIVIKNGGKDLLDNEIKIIYPCSVNKTTIKLKR